MAESGPLPNFFISYNRADQDWAKWIAWEVEEAGYKVIIEAWDFGPGGNFVQKMDKAVAEAKRTIAVLSQNYLSAQFAFAEWAAAFAQDPTVEKGKLVTVRIADCDLKGLLSTIDYIDLVGLDESAASEKLRAGLQRGRAQRKTRPVFPAAPSRATKPLFPPTSSNSVRRQRRWPPPAEPALCLGRDTQVNDLVKTLLSDHLEPTPIVGGPGMGKSTVLLSALYNPRVKERYNDRRYFVQCKVAPSRPTLVQAIAKEIEVSPSGSDVESRSCARSWKGPRRCWPSMVSKSPGLPTRAMSRISSPPPSLRSLASPSWPRFKGSPDPAGSSGER